MNYEKHYNLLIDKYKHYKFSVDEYTEIHHIVPVFMFKHNKRGSTLVGHHEGDHDAPQNLIKLPLRAHLLAHALLAKMYQNTRYSNAAASALCFFFSKGMGLKHPRSKLFKPGMSKKYEWLKIKGKAAISAARKGTMPAKDAITGKMVGSVSTTDPRVLSGELVHHSKGKIISAEVRKKYAKFGMDNANAKRHITEADIFNTLEKSIRPDGRLIAKTFWEVLKSTLNCTSSLIGKRFGSFNNFIDAYKKTGRPIIYDTYYRENKTKYISNLKWITNGIETKKILPTEELPPNWYYGRTLRKK